MKFSAKFPHGLKVPFEPIMDWATFELEWIEQSCLDHCLEAADETSAVLQEWRYLWNKERQARLAPLICMSCGVPVQKSPDSVQPPCPNCQSLVFTSAS